MKVRLQNWLKSSSQNGRTWILAKIKYTNNFAPNLLVNFLPWSSTIHNFKLTIKDKIFLWRKKQVKKVVLQQKNSQMLAHSGIKVKEACHSKEKTQIFRKNSPNLCTNKRTFGVEQKENKWLSNFQSCKNTKEKCKIYSVFKKA